jgi:HAD superfamily hydrolase (TIGR01459 family)
MTTFLDRLGALQNAYDILLCDIWGVVHNGETAFAESCAALAEWRAKKGPVILISNSPRPSPGVVEQMDDLGVPRAAWSDIVTSGDVTRVLLIERRAAPVFVLGPERDEPLYEGLGLRFAPLEDAAFICCTGLVDDEVETPEDYRAMLTVAATRDLEMICANPDIVVQRGDRMIPCGGALARLYGELGGRTVMAGKPHPPIYERCLVVAEDLIGRPVDRARVLAIGDGVATDIAGANGQGLDVLFIGGGIHGSAAVTRDGRLDEAATLATLTASGVTARYAMAALR